MYEKNLILKLSDNSTFILNFTNLIFEIIKLRFVDSSNLKNFKFSINIKISKLKFLNKVLVLEKF